MSSIDHIYVSEDLESKTQTYKLDNSSSDHLPIMAKIVRNKKRIKQHKTITKRSTKNFNKTIWCETIKKIKEKCENEAEENLDNLVDNIGQIMIGTSERVIQNSTSNYFIVLHCSLLTCFSLTKAIA